MDLGLAAMQKRGSSGQKTPLAGPWIFFFFPPRHSLFLTFGRHAFGKVPCHGVSLHIFDSPRESWFA